LSAGLRLRVVKKIGKWSEIFEVKMKDSNFLLRFLDIIWSINVAEFDVHLVGFKISEEVQKKKAYLHNFLLYLIHYT
jgi:hypothetical protein